MSHSDTETGPAIGRPPIGPKAQAAVDPVFFARIKAEAEAAGVPRTFVWREVLYAGLRATGRASRAEIARALEELPCRLDGAR